MTPNSAWEHLSSSLRKGRLTRRDFLGYASALGISAALTTSALAQTPKRGGHLVLGEDAATASSSLDPARFTGAWLTSLGLQLYDQLVEVDRDFQAKPALAESWDTSADVTKWVFKLRRGVTFHNGKEMKAPDVVYSLNHHRGEQSKSIAKSLLEPIVDIAATDPYEVTITLKNGNADLPYIIWDFHLGIGPEGSKFDDGVGTGAFVLQSFEPGVRATTRRNKDDWRSDRGYVDTVEVLGINDPVARLSALQSGSIHVMNRVEPKTAEALASQPNFQLFNVAGGGHYTFPMRCDIAPFNNSDLRLAMKFAVDRDRMLKTVLRGYGKIGNDQPIPAFDPFFAPNIAQRLYDPEKAAFHLKRSGYDGPIVLSTSEVAAPGGVEAAQVFQASAASAGIKIEIDRQPGSGYFDNVWMKKPFTTASWSGRPTADLLLSLLYASDAKWNETFWKRPAFDALLLQARKELDTNRRRAMYAELQQMIHDDGGAVIPLFYNFLDAGVATVRGWEDTPTLPQSGYRAAQKIWFSDA
jgi:peptide/nickel transport system substrate-binding protein